MDEKHFQRAICLPLAIGSQARTKHASSTLCAFKMLPEGQMGPVPASRTSQYSPEPTEANNSSKMAMWGHSPPPPPLPRGYTLEQKHSCGCEAPEKALSV